MSITLKQSYTYFTINFTLLFQITKRDSNKLCHMFVDNFQTHILDNKKGIKEANDNSLHSVSR